jgi:phage-related protein
MVWGVKEWGTEVSDFLSEVGHPAAARILRDLLRMATEGHAYRGDTKSLGGGLRELRVRHDGMAYRLIYIHHSGAAVFLVCFAKKTQKTPPDKIELAKKRYAQTLSTEVDLGHIKLN